MGAAPMKYKKIILGAQKEKKTVGRIHFVKVHFFLAHDAGIPNNDVQKQT